MSIGIDQGGAPGPVVFTPPLPSPIPPYPAGAGGATTAPPDTYEKTIEDQQLVVGGQNNPIRIVYGRTWIGGDIAGITGDSDGNLIILYVWCEGEVDAVEKIKVNGGDIGGGDVFCTHYTGTLAQDVDPTIAAAFHAQGKFYSDRLPGICYSVVRVPPGASTGFPQATALIRGLKVSTSEGGAKTYSTDAAYCIADFIENTVYGMSRSVDWATVADVASHCAEMVGSPAETRRVFSMVIDSPKPVDQWLSAMADYASCWVYPDGGTYRLVADATGTVGNTKTVTGITQAHPPVVQSPFHGFVGGEILRVAGVAGMVEINGVVAVAELVDNFHVRLRGVNSSSFSAYTSGGTITHIGTSVYSFNASNIQAGTFRVQKASAMDAPTVVEVDYTLTSQYPWRTDTTDPVFVPGVYDNPPTVPFRRTRISKPGICRKSEATRYAIELLNGAQLNDLSAQFQAFDVAIKLQVGDLIDVTHPLGLEAKIMRLQQAQPNTPGRWSLSALEHDDAKYSDFVVSDPDPSDTPLPDPLHPPAVTNLQVTGSVYQTETGLFASRLGVTWDAAAPAYPFVRYYSIEIRAGGVLQESANVYGPEYVSKPIVENVPYEVSVAIVTTLDVRGAATKATITYAGKSAKPKDMDRIDGFEVGGTVYLSWSGKASDGGPLDLDLTAIGLKYGAPGGNWATATWLDRVAAPAIRYTTQVIPAGSWVIYAKALDSVRSQEFPWGQESVNAVSVPITVTSDAGAFLAGSYDFASATLTNMVQVRDGTGATIWVSDNGTVASSVFTSTPLSSNYPNIASTYPGGFTSTLETDHHDFGLAVAGTWTGTVFYWDISGTATAYLDVSSADSGYTGYSALTAGVTGRWSKLRITSTGTLAVSALGSVHVVTVGRTETGNVTTSAAGAATVTLAGKYQKAVSIQVTPATGATPYVTTYDNVVVGSGTNSFDAYAFNLAGTKVAVACTYQFSGI